MGHHYAPRKYLRGFCEPGAEDWLWVYDRKYKQFKRKHVGGVAQEKGFYSEEDEAELNRIVETPANPVLDKLREGGSISEAERETLSAYIATTIYRVPYRRSRMLKAAPSLFEQTIEDRRQWILREGERQKVAPEKVQRKLRQLDEFRDQHAGNPAALIPDKIRTPWPSELSCQLIFRMTWRLLTTSGPVFFLTTDNPAVFDWKRGLGQKDSELLFPISSSLLLHARWQPGNQCERIAADEACVNEMNQRMAAASSRFLFYHSREEWVMTLGDSFPCEPSMASNA
ncbi:MAG: DUF4238 domain-containing protein [Planctomycetes bacterium]|nr:DUF4238 domain-containing protein [Planctomycetota bacterium]